MRPPMLFAVFCAAGALGCVRYFPGTEIPDNADTQAIRAIMDRYRAAVEAKDVGTILSLVADTYRDDGGTIQTEDDLDYASLRDVIPRRLEKTKDATLYMELKRIDVQQDVAVATYSYVWRYRLPSLTSGQASDSDIMQMRFKRLGGEWKITRGL